MSAFAELYLRDVLIRMNFIRVRSRVLMSSPLPIDMAPQRRGLRRVDLVVVKKLAPRRAAPPDHDRVHMPGRFGPCRDKT